jgi:hypothetical protein
MAESMAEIMAEIVAEIMVEKPKKGEAHSKFKLSSFSTIKGPRVVWFIQEVES